MKKSLLLLSLLLASFQVLAQVQPIKEIFIPEGNFPVKDFVKVAVVQWAPSAAAPLAPKKAVDNHKAAQRAKLEEYIRLASSQGAEYIVTPEFGTVGYPDIADLPPEEDNFRNRKDIQFYVEDIKGSTAVHFAKLALELKVWIQIGFPEVEKATDKYFNSVLVFNPKGKTVAHYRKQSLFQIETNYLSKGEKIVTFNSPMGKVGLGICSDIYAEYVMSKYEKEKLNIFSISTSWAQYNSGFSAYVKAAKRLKSYAMAANHDYFPDSGVINPNGSTQSHIRQTTGIAFGFIPRIKK